MKLFLFPLLFISFLSFSQQPKLVGFSTVGGTFNNGNMFQVDANGDDLVQFSVMNGQELAYFPSGSPIMTSTGKFYGITNNFGGVSNQNVLFEFDTITNQYVNKVQFSGQDGYMSWSQMVEGSNLKLYGTTEQGGLNGDGVIFEYDPITNIYTTVFNFSSSTSGTLPTAGLIQATNGLLYGTTLLGGEYDKGVLFQFDFNTMTFLKLLDFDGIDNGGSPNKAMIELSSGVLLGIAGGGLYDSGILFEFDMVTNVLTKKYDFDGVSIGQPRFITEGLNNNIYGTALGGDYDYGVIFEYNPILNTLVKNVDLDGTFGRFPVYLLEVSENIFYGNTAVSPIGGSTYDSDIIYEYNSLTQTCVSKFELNFFEGYGSDISGPMMLDGNWLYSMGSSGGIQHGGAFFKYNYITNSYKELIDFNSQNVGETPKGNLIITSENNLYGLNSNGGDNDFGTLIQVYPNSKFVQKLIDFDGAIKGAVPCGSLLESSNGKLYGLTSEGGVSNKGVLFEYDLNTNVYSKHFNFSALNGEIPLGSLVEVNSILYGMTSTGGANSLGVLFKFNTLTNMFTKLVDFDGVNMGSIPFGDLILGSNGKLYGMTSEGGDYNLGVIFEYDIATNFLVKKIDFDGVNFGSTPKGSLLEHGSDLLYGMTSTGGVNNKGVIFNYNFSTNDAMKLVDFDGLNGENPLGNVTFSSNGNLFGLTSGGGVNSKGVLFEFNPTLNEYVKKYDFKSNSNGGSPTGSLLEILICPDYTLQESQIVCQGDVVTFPDGNLLAVFSDTTYISNLIGIYGCDSLITTDVLIHQINFLQDSTICTGTSYTFPDGTTQTNITTGFDYISNLSSTITGCDSIITTSITVTSFDNSATLSGVTITATEMNADNYVWLDCANNVPFAYISFPTLEMPFPGSYSIQITKNGCIDTSNCITITNQDFYDLPNYTPLSVEVFAFPVSALDTCDGFALGFVNGGFPPYNFDWFSQANNENTDELDSLCEGFHTLKVYDNIGDSTFVDYFVTDSSNWYDWYEENATFVDTIYLQTENCVIDMNLPLDSSYISNFYYLYSGIGVNEEYYYMEISYFQTGMQYTFGDTVLMELNGVYLIDFSITCPTKSTARIKTILTTLDYPTILAINKNNQNQFKIYPNPTLNTITIDLGKTNSNSNILITDFSGKIIYNESSVNAKAIKVNLTKYSAGIYFVTVENSTGKNVIKLVKQ